MNRRDWRRHPDQRLISRTWRRIALHTAGLFASGVVVMDLLAVGFVFNAEQHDADMQLDQVTNDPDALTNPPVDIVVYQVDRGALRSSPGARPEPLDAAAIREPPTQDQVVRRDGRQYLVRTYRNGPTTVQVGLDLTRRDRERSRLFMGLAADGVVGVGFAGGLGALIARRAIAPLGHAIERQQRFVADASHELRTPLTRLHTRAQLVEWELRSDPDHERVRADVEQLVRGTRQMGEVVEELLVAAQLRVEPQRYEPVDLGPLAEQVAESERPRAAARTVTVDVVDMFDIVGATGPVVGGAGTSLRRVLSSLVDNALSHTPDGGRVTIELAPADHGFIEVRVRDDGVGFDPATAERMFQRFYRGDHGGARRFGLGLALVREVVSAHGGTVTARSSPGRGACFVVRLPAWTG